MNILLAKKISERITPNRPFFEYHYEFQERKNNLKEKFHKKLLIAQSAISEQMQQYRMAGISVHDQVSSFIKELSQGKNVFECLTILALKVPQENENVFTPRQLKHREGLIYSLFAEKSLVDKRGRTTVNLSNSKKNDSHDLNTELSLHWDYCARIIHIGTQWINSEFSLVKSDWNYFLNDYGTIRPGHEQIIIEGLHYGFNGNYLVSSHLLIPQIEDALRYLLECNGVLCSKILKSLNQKDEILDELLKHPELTELLGKEFIFELSRLLIDPGLNFRNDGFHGKLTYEKYWSQLSVYVWYLALRFYAFGPLILKQKFVLKPTDSLKPKI